MLPCYDLQIIMPVTLAAPVFIEIEIKKSRFLAWVEPIADASAAKARIEALRRQYPDARHVCFAFYVQGNSGMSDDGEPSGTAGKPMFNVLNHKNLVNVLAVVVRYFGGIKLGAGGLSRAYGGAVSQALESAEYLPVETPVKLEVRFPFALESSIRRICQHHDLNLDQIQYSEHVQAVLITTESQLNQVMADLKAVAPGNSDLDVRVAD